MTVIDLEIASKKEAYLTRVKELRLKNFSRNLPFLILSDKLPEGQAYREFSDGRIELQEISVTGSKYNSTVLRTLSAIEADLIRKEYGLF